MTKIRDGDLYKVIKIAGREFEIKYGFYSDNDKKRWSEPIPIFPNFIKTPMYTDNGKAFVTAEQDVCVHYSPKNETSGEEWCNDCIHFKEGEEIIGICQNENNKLR